MGTAHQPRNMPQGPDTAPGIGNVIMRVQGWNLVFLVALIAYVTIRGVFARQTKSNEKLVRQNDACERALLVAVGIGSLLLPLLYLFTNWLGFADYRLPA